jgi:succinoglycan biosynthesis protein ExoO
MTTPPTISVIMANFNKARFLAAAIQSLMAQTLPSWELILVDDASTDDSIAVAKRATNGDPRVVIIQQRQNRGAAAARNRGFEVARGDWIAIFDSDDLMLPERLEKLLYRASCDGAEMVADNFFHFSETRKPRRHLRTQAPRWIDFAEFANSTCLYSPAPDLGYLKPMIRRDIIRQFRAHYDERLRIGEDYNFLAGFLASGRRLRLEPSPMHLYRKHGESLSSRMTPTDIHALFEADERLAKDNALTHAERAALLRRRRSLEAVLTYDRMIQAFKRRDAGHALHLALSYPRMWPLLSQRVMRYMRRAVRRVAQGKGGATLSGRPTAMAAVCSRAVDRAIREARRDAITPFELSQAADHSTMKESSSL